MNVWELRCANINEYAMVVPDSEWDMLDGIFDIDGRPLDFTNIVKCVDIERSEKSYGGGIRSEVFYDINVARSAAVFKDPSTAAFRMYTNDPGKDLIEKIAEDAGLTGIECGPPRRF